MAADLGSFSVEKIDSLQWKIVFVISASDSCFPSPRSLNAELGEEEERRLFYVSITRTEDQLYVCYPMRLGNRGGYEIQVPSRFISEVPPELFEKWNVSGEELSKDAA